jgi:hypothetical protein
MEKKQAATSAQKNSRWKANINRIIDILLVFNPPKRSIKKE